MCLCRSPGYAELVDLGAEVGEAAGRQIVDVVGVDSPGVTIPLDRRDATGGEDPRRVHRGGSQDAEWIGPLSADLAGQEIPKAATDVGGRCSAGSVDVGIEPGGGIGTERAWRHRPLDGRPNPGRQSGLDGRGQLGSVAMEPFVVAFNQGDPISPGTRRPGGSTARCDADPGRPTAL